MRIWPPWASSAMAITVLSTAPSYSRRLDPCLLCGMLPSATRRTIRVCQLPIRSSRADNLALCLSAVCLSMLLCGLHQCQCSAAAATMGKGERCCEDGFILPDFCKQGLQHLRAFANPRGKAHAHPKAPEHDIVCLHLHNAAAPSSCTYGSSG